MAKLEAKKVAGLSDLNKVAADMDGVFVFVPARDETSAEAPTEVIQGAVRRIEPDLDGGKIGIFTLKTDSADYELIAAQIGVPGVLAMVRGGGMGSATGKITEAKLVEAYAAAAKPSGCGCSGSCGDGDGCCG